MGSKGAESGEGQEGERMKYKKKPIEVEAIQFTGNIEELQRFTDELVAIASEGPMIKTLEGWMRFKEGDYIIKGIKGEFYPCRKDIFEETYERASK